VKKILCVFFVLLLSSLSFADAATWRVKVPDAKGGQRKATLTFDDTKKIVEVRTVKGDAVDIPYEQIDKCSYEYTKKHRITQGVLLAAVSPAAGIIVFFTKSRSHWLEFDYRDQEIPKVFVVRMDKREYLNILDALKAHTGKEAEILGNAKKK